MSGIDLHTHSTASDGTESPAVVVTSAQPGRARRRRAHRPRHRAWLVRGGRGGRASSASAWSAASRSPARGTGGPSTCSATSSTPTTPAWPARSGMPARPGQPAAADGREDGGGRDPHHLRGGRRAGAARAPPRAGRTSPTRSSPTAPSRTGTRRSSAGSATTARTTCAITRPTRSTRCAWSSRPAGSPCTPIRSGAVAGAGAGDAVIEEMAAAGLGGLGGLPSRPRRRRRAPAWPRARGAARTCSSPARATTTGPARRTGSARTPPRPRCSPRSRHVPADGFRCCDDRQPLGGADHLRLDADHAHRHHGPARRRADLPRPHRPDDAHASGPGRRGGLRWWRSG